MKKLLVGTLLVTAVSLAQATPTPIDITVSGGSLAVAAPKSDLGDFGDGTVYNWLKNDVISYDSLTSSSLSAPTSIAGQTGLTGNAGGTSINLDVTGYDYLFLHWGGKDGGWGEAFYVGGLTGDFTFSNSAIGTNPEVGGLSFYSFYGPTSCVPDGASTMILLGSALLGLAAGVRYFKKEAAQA